MLAVLLVLPAAFVTGCALGRLGWVLAVLWYRSAPRETQGVNDAWDHPAPEESERYRLAPVGESPRAHRRHRLVKGVRP